MTHELKAALRRSLALARKALGPAAAAPGELDAGDEDEEGDEDERTALEPGQQAGGAPPPRT